jgi:small-conductance mechanosensitive channel
VADSAPKPPIGGLQRSGAAQRPAAQPSQATPEQAAGFKALLERLEQQAEALDAKARADLRGEELAQAVDEARTSLEDVLALQDRLLEAWRQSRHQADRKGPA